MSILVEVICVAADGTEQRQPVLAIERQELAMETLGLSLAEGKSLLQEVQSFVVAHQVNEDLRHRRACPACGQLYTQKEAGNTTVKTVFGTVPVPNPRWHRCTCQTKGTKTFRPTNAWLEGRTSPERLYLETKWASLIPFESTT